MPSFKPPEPFSPPQGSVAEAWRKWRQQFELYYDADDVGSKPIARQRAMLLVSIGEIGLDIYNTLTFAVDGDQRTVQVILDAFSTHFQPYRNVTFKRYLFFTCVQTASQTIDQFVTELKNRARDCEFGGLTDSLVRDIVICGIRNGDLRERLLKEANLTLPLAVDICCVDESSKQQTQMMQDTTNQKVGVHAFLRPKPAQKQGPGRQIPSKQGNFRSAIQPGFSGGVRDHKMGRTTGEWTSECSRCLRHHSPGSCPAFGKKMQQML